jgi:disease resistance protein RPM1
VFDDVWNLHAWEAIQFGLLEVPNDCGSRIIVTTRIEAVADACSGHFIYHMKPLSIEDSKKLFLSNAFGHMLASCPRELEDVMANILRGCGGMPLAIVTVATILGGYRSPRSIDKWETVCKLIGPCQMDTNPTIEGMRHIVALSYNHLPHELKGCMMYLSIFPEDYEINKNRLLSRWIAEGLIPEKRGWTLTEVAEYYLDQLLRRKMVVPRIGDDGKMESCRVHDVLLEVLVSKSLESNFVSLLGGQYAGMSYDRIRRLSIQGDDDRSLLNLPNKRLQGISVEHVRSLSVFPLRGGKWRLLDYLDKFTMLRVLDLEDCKGLTPHHMRCICRLYLLKFLNLKGTDIKEVPPQVGKLEHLQTLDIRNTDLGGLPDSLTHLEKLDRLQFSSTRGWDIMWRLPRRLRKMKALRVVSNAVLGDDIVVAHEVGELEKLQEMCLYIDSHSIGNNYKVLQTLAMSLSRMYSLRSLNIGDLGWTSSILEFLHQLPRSPFLLRFLRITGQIGGRLPAWIGALTNLVEFVIAWVELSGDEPFGILCKLPNLRSISMERRYYTDDKLVARTCHNFPALANLTMTCSGQGDPAPSVFQFEEGAMAKLETLVLDFQDYDKTIRGIEHLTNLREVRLIGKKSNPALHSALEQLKAENGRRTESNKFQMVVKYYEE